MGDENENEIREAHVLAYQARRARQRSVGGWHLVTVEPKCEMKAIEKLKDNGFEGFCPMWTKRYRWSRASRVKIVERDLPAFPGYLFVERPLVLKRFWRPMKKTRYDAQGRPIDIIEWLADIEETEHVMGIVRRDGEASIFPDEIIANLRHAMALGCFVEDARNGQPKYVDKGMTPEERERERAEAADVFAALRQKYKPDAQVKAIDGPFASFVGRIKAAPVKDRIKVIFDLLGGETQVDMLASQLEPLT